MNIENGKRLRVSIAHVVFWPYLGVKLKSRRGVFVSMHRKMGRRHNVCATEIFRRRDIGAGHGAIHGIVRH